MVFGKNSMLAICFLSVGCLSAFLSSQAIAQASSEAPRFLARESLVELGDLSSASDQRKVFQISASMGALARMLALREDQQDAWAAFLKETLAAFLASASPIAIHQGAGQTPEMRFAMREAVLKAHLARIAHYRVEIRRFRGILDPEQKDIFDKNFIIDRKIGLEGNPFVPEG